MLGERCEELRLEYHGIVGDRQFAIRDVNGKFGSGKSTHRFRKIDGLFGFQAGYRNESLKFRFPSGEVLSGHDHAINEALSCALGQPVTLVQENKISHLDAGPIHILTSASLACLQSALPHSLLDERRFCPNLFIDLPGANPAERQWIGKHLLIGKEVELKISTSTKRCGMIAFSQSDLPIGPAILRHVTQEAELHFGVYAEVVVPGTMRAGDAVSFLQSGKEPDPY